MAADVLQFPAPAEIEKRWLVQELFGQVRSVIPLELRKQASLGLTDDEARRLTPELAEYVKTIRPDPHKVFVIIVPIGVGEIWGVNLRGDLVYRKDMIPDVTSAEYQRRPYGFPTFRTATFFGHHKNKLHKGDPGLGGVPFVTFNPQMAWVEGVLECDLPAVEAHYPDLLPGILSGQFQISMGMYALADACLRCGHVRNGPLAKACLHITPPRDGGELGRIYGDGTVGGMANIRPRFFDVSDVGRRADSIAWAMKKVAAAETRPPELWSDAKAALRRLQLAGLIPDPTRLPKKGEKELEKLSLVKRAMDKLAAEEPRLSPAALLATPELTAGALPELARAGIMLRPPEFQTLLLKATQPALAAQLLAERRTFPLTPADFMLTAAPAGAPFFITPYGIARWIGSNLSPWRSWDAQLLASRLAQPPPVFRSPLAEPAPTEWAPTAALPDVKAAYIAHLLQTLTALLARTSAAPELLSLSSEPGARTLAKEAGLGPLAALLPALYFAKLFGADVLAQAATLPGTTPDGVPVERSFLQKLLLWNPLLGTSFLGLAGQGAQALTPRLEALLLRRL